MKPVLFAAALALLGAAATTTAQGRALSPAPTDTIVVRLPNKVIMTLVVQDAAQLRQLPQYHLDSLVARLGGYIQRADEAAQKASTDRVTVQYFPNQDQPGQGLPEEVRITTRKRTGSDRVDVALDKLFGLKVRVDEQGHKSYSNKNASRQESDEQRQARRDSLRMARNEHHSSSTHVIFDLGLNALVNNHVEQAAGLPGGTPPDLRTGGSRYVNFGLNFQQRLGGRRSPLYLALGPEFSFNNYMLEGNYKWVNVNGLTSTVLETNGRQYQKTKLATSTLTVPLMLQLNTHGHSHFRLGAGGFVGYRLASWTKLKYFEEGTTYKDKDYGSYNLNDWQYGLQGVVGFKALTFFAKYNLNPLFRDGQGLQAQTLSFGLRLLH